MSSGWVGILTCELHFPEAHSLKEKRMLLRSAKAQLERRVGASVAEVDHHDVWQRARITAALVTREHHEAIARDGVTPHHRRSFRPVQLALGLA